jgi:hypothetical protein
MRYMTSNLVSTDWSGRSPFGQSAELIYQLDARVCAHPKPRM